MVGAEPARSADSPRSPHTGHERGQQGHVDREPRASFWHPSNLVDVEMLSEKISAFHASNAGAHPRPLATTTAAVGCGAC